MDYIGEVGNMRGKDPSSDLYWRRTDGGRKGSQQWPILPILVKDGWRKESSQLWPTLVKEECWKERLTAGVYIGEGGRMEGKAPVLAYIGEGGMMGGKAPSRGLYW